MTAPRPVYDGVLDFAHFAFDGTILVEKGDLMYHDTNDVKPASSQSDSGTELKNQTMFARRFAGVAAETRLVGDTAAMTDFPVATDWAGEMDCASTTFEVGDLVTIDEHSGGTYLEDQKLVKTTDPILAIGECIKRYSAATTRVLVRLKSKILGHGKPGGLSFPVLDMGVPVASTAGADIVLTAADYPFLAIDPGGAGRNLDLPAVAKNLFFVIKNTADAAEVITIRLTGGGATVCTPTQNETAVLWNDGATWYGIVAAHN